MRHFLPLLLLCVVAHAWPADLPVPATGAGDMPGYTEDAREDGATRLGVVWPNPRFTDNGNGTVTDNLTTLVWLKNTGAIGYKTWADALTACAGLASGQAGLTDGSAAGQWRLPSVRELMSLDCVNYSTPGLANTAGTAQWTEGNPFSSVAGVSYYYWSSTTYASDTNSAWMGIGGEAKVAPQDKANTNKVWPVRAGP